jgi:hypothetical protein
MSGKTETMTPPDDSDEGGKRQRSTIGFPYMALPDAIEIAKAIHDNVSRGSCDEDQLAVWTSQSAKSSGFRVQVSAARMFGLIENDGGSYKLTPLGVSIVSPDQAREAKATAFLNVPLFKAMYDEYKSGSVPPAAAIERDMARLGVSSKQTGRARVAFDKSAEEAGFYEHGKNRLVAPGIAAGEKPPPKPDESEGNGTGGNDGGGLDPVISALIQKLPKGKTKWSVDDRVTWLQMIAMAFDMAYGIEAKINITKDKIVWPKQESPPSA